MASGLVPNTVKTRILSDIPFNRQPDSSSMHNLSDCFQSGNLILKVFSILAFEQHEYIGLLAGVGYWSDGIFLMVFTFNSIPGIHLAIFIISSEKPCQLVQFDEVR